MSRLYEYQKRILSVCLICLMCMSVYACGKKQDIMEKIKDLECTVIVEDNIPEELFNMIEQKKKDAVEEPCIFCTGQILCKCLKAIGLDDRTVWTVIYREYGRTRQQSIRR